MGSRAAHRAAKGAKDVYRGYIPIDLPQNRPPSRIRPWWKVLGKPRVTLYPKEEVEGFSAEPEYPKLNDGSSLGIKNQIRYDWYDNIAQLPSLDQKLYEIGRHTDFYMAHLGNWTSTYNSLPVVKYLTNTTLIESLPDCYSSGNELSEPDQVLLDTIKSLILNQIQLDKYDSVKDNPSYVSKSSRNAGRQDYKSNIMVQNIFMAIKKCLSLESNTDLLNYKYDLSASVRSWWYHSGFKPPNGKKFYNSRVDKEGNINQMIQVDGSTALCIRSDSMMEPIVSTTEPSLSEKFTLEKADHPLRYYRAVFKFKKPVTLPGFWMEEQSKFDFPHTCFLTTDCLHNRNRKLYFNAKIADDDENCLTSQSMLSAFSWLNGLSVYHGYTPFHELDYPFTCQTITTDGQNWMFNVYQLNSHSFHRDFQESVKSNLCWTSGLLKLYDKFENNEFKGVNDQVVRLIVKFLSQKTSPSYTSQLKLRPHLSVDERSPEEKEDTMKQLRVQFEGRKNKWLAHQWKVPLWEHIFFRSKENRNRITFMKPRWHIPKPLPPKIFD